MYLRQLVATMISGRIGAVCDVDEGETWVGGWSQWGWFAGGSANGSRYRVFERTSTFHAAQQHCLQLGGYLARIDTVREQVFIEDFLRHTLDDLIAFDGQYITPYCRLDTKLYTVSPKRPLFYFFK